jgi:SAM-dependent methyltransferase
MTDQPAGQFTFSRDAQLWSDLYERPTTLWQHNMALRRDYALDYARRNLRPPARVLDLGCGAGVLLEGLVESGFTVTGIEPSGDMLTLARTRVARFSESQYRLINASCESMPCADSEFDAILCMGVFGYIDDVDGALAEIRRVLKPGGVFLMSVRNGKNTMVSDPWQMVRWAFRKGVRTPRRRKPGAGQSRAGGGEQRFQIEIQDSPQNVIRGVTRRGFALDAFDGFGFGPPRLFGRAVLPLSLSIRLSDSLNRTFRRLGASSTTSWVADVSMYAFRKI